MIFITGPLYSGKRTFARRLGGRQIADAQELAAGAENLERLADELAAQYDVVMATEIGGGIVPLEAEQRRAREAAEEGASSTERERELLGWQVSELRELAFDADEWATLNQEQARLAHAAGLIEGSAEVLDGLAEGEYAVVPQCHSHGTKTE